MNIQDFKNNANALLMITSDDWTKNFVQSLLDQVNKGKNLSDKQINLFNKKLDSMLNPPASVEVDQEFLKQINLLKTKTKSEWLLGFCDSIITQLKDGRALSEKQMDIFKAKYDKLVLKIKPSKEIQIQPVVHHEQEDKRTNDSGWGEADGCRGNMWNHSWGGEIPHSVGDGVMDDVTGWCGMKDEDQDVVNGWGGEIADDGWGGDEW